MQQPVLVVGGGFGGVYATKRLLEKGRRVILISESQYFTFTPLLHEVATGSLLAHDIAFEYEGFFRSPRFEFICGRVTRIEPDQKRVWIGETSLSYHALVLATGSRTNERIIKGTEHARELKNVDDALAIKKAIMAKAQRPEKSVSVTVIGGGPTGCELVFEIQRFLMAIKKRHPTLMSHVRLIHAKQEIGGATKPQMQTYIEDRIVRSGIEVIRPALAREINQTHIITDRGTFASDVTILVAGVRPNTDGFVGALPCDPLGHVMIEPTLEVRGLEDVYALGDIIRMGEMVIPKLAQTAIQEAHVVAENILRKQQRQPLFPYRPRIKGFLLSLGYGDGVGDVFGMVVKGPLAWYIWRTIYLFKTPGLTNKLRVAFSWTIGLFTGRDLASL